MWWSCFILAECFHILRHMILLASARQISGQSDKAGQHALDRVQWGRERWAGRAASIRGDAVRRCAPPAENTPFTCIPLFTQGVVCRATHWWPQHFLHYRGHYRSVGKAQGKSMDRWQEEKARGPRTCVDQGERIQAQLPLRWRANSLSWLWPALSDPSHPLQPHLLLLY